MDNNMKKRWISLYVENQVGVLSKISGLFSGKSYNLDSLTEYIKENGQYYISLNGHTQTPPTSEEEEEIEL